MRFFIVPPSTRESDPAWPRVAPDKSPKNSPTTVETPTPMITAEGGTAIGTGVVTARTTTASSHAMTTPD
jgi:hypothetical protein